MYERACDLTKPASRRSDLRTRYTGHALSRRHAQSKVRSGGEDGQMSVCGRVDRYR